MAKTNKDYFGLGRVASIILAIIPVTAWLLGAITRFKEGKIVAGIIRILPIIGLPLWIVDMIMMFAKGRILRLLNV